MCKCREGACEAAKGALYPEYVIHKATEGAIETEEADGIPIEDEKEGGGQDCEAED